jgi:succinyl-CoA synthetase beta subunit
MNIHEHQAKAVLAEFGVPVPRGFPAFTVKDAVKAAKDLKGTKVADPRRRPRQGQVRRPARHRQGRRARRRLGG